MVATYFRQVMHGEELVTCGNGEQIRDYAYAIDLVKGILVGLESKVASVYQLGTGIPTTLNSLIDQIR